MAVSSVFIKFIKFYNYKIYSVRLRPINIAAVNYPKPNFGSLFLRLLFFAPYEIK